MNNTFLTDEISMETLEPAFLAMTAVLGLIGIILALMMVLAVYIYIALSLGKIAKDRGQKKHWLSWIPLVNMFLFPMMVGKKWYWGFLFFLPIVSPVFLAICIWDLLAKSGRDGRWALILIAGIADEWAFSGISFLYLIIVLGILAWRNKK
jgi:hypothetical protein